jgi:creatinine amidohydrolase/Fe(II)-dependent formamide hydrolase-like protein
MTGGINMGLAEVPKFIPTKSPNLAFEDSKVGRMKQEIWEADDAKVDAMLAEFGIPAAPEWGKPGTYIQTTIRKQVEANRKLNDVVLIPVGCTEMHGAHTVSAMDTFFVTSICEGVRRYTAKQGRPVNIALPPLNYGCHPLHHIGMPGTIVVHEQTAIDLLEDVMLGLWNDGFRKQIIINNHGQLWVLESALQRFCKKYQLPGIFRVIDWHRAVREFFMPKECGGEYDTPFTHADEAETSIGLLLFPEMVEMKYAVDTDPVDLLPGGHMDSSVDLWRRPSRWSEGEGHVAMELYGTPEGVVGHATKASARKAKRPILAIMKYLALLIDEYLEVYPPGTVPDAEKMVLRTNQEIEAYLKEPLSPGWKSVYGMPKLNF